MRKNVLITGAAGFIGAHFVEHFLSTGKYNVIAMESFWHKGSISRLKEIGLDMTDGTFELVQHDLTVPVDQALVAQIEHFSRIMYQCDRRTKVDYIINLASDSAVEHSVADPADCWMNNTKLILNMLELARKLKPEKFIQMSTDEVFGDYSGDGAGNTEWDILLPSNPYAASKAAQEMLCQSYWRTFETPVVLVNTMNNIGERQAVEKFMPRIIEHLSTGKVVKIYTDRHGTPGKRVYLDAKNHADAVQFIIENGPQVMYQSGHSGHDRPDRYNVCGNVELNNFEFAQMVSRVMGKTLECEMIQSESLRPGYDKRYLLDGSKLAKLGWKPKIPFDETLGRIVSHAINNPWWIGA